MTIPTNSDSTTFYISATEEGENAAFLPPIVSISPPGSMRATISGNARNGDVVDYANPQSFVVHYLCDRIAESTVTISLHQPIGRTIDFSFTKQCSRLTRYTNEYYW